jgi:thiamine kinase-like enzyme
MSEDARKRAADLAFWSGNVAPEAIAGSTSNHNFMVEDDGQRFFVRVADDAYEHAIFRFNEITVTQAAHAAGLSPDAVHHEDGVIVFEYVENGRPLAPSDLREAAVLERTVGLIGRCHLDLPGYLEVPGPMFWPFQAIRRNARILSDSGGRHARRIAGLMSACERLENAIGAIRPTFCHNDLRAANIIDDGERLWLVDWEFGGWNDPLYDLANLASSNLFDDDQESRLLELYRAVGEDDGGPRRFAAMKCTSLLRQATWSMVGELFSRMDIDFAGQSDDLLARFDAALKNFRTI